MFQQKQKDMKYYLRYSNTIDADIERGYSYNWGDIDERTGSAEEAAEAYRCDIEDLEVVNGIYNQMLPGLCVFELEAETLEEAIEEAENANFGGDYHAGNGISYSILTGTYVGHCAEGGCIIVKEKLFTK